LALPEWFRCLLFVFSHRLPPYPISSSTRAVAPSR
jgi:hypothetical protein